ncbi:hypothetical protein ACWCQW_47415 [Streptomyces mirabilis]
MLKSLSTAVVRFVNEVMFPPPVELTHEEARLIARCTTERWEQWTTERGLTGLVLGAHSAWTLGLVLHCRLLGRLQFGDVEDRGMHIATGLGLVRARQMMADDHYGLDTEMIATGMIGTHRQWHGSVIYAARSDRSDRVDLWIGFHDRLAQTTAAVDAEAARRKAREEADKEAARQQRERDARMTGTGGGTHGQTVGIPKFRNLADLRVHEGAGTAHGTGSGTSSQRARTLVRQGVKDAPTLARLLADEGHRVPSDSYLRRLIREGRS